MRNNLPFCEKQYPVPMCHRDAVQRQLNRANFDRSFCPNFSLTATPLTALFKGKNKWRWTGSREASYLRTCRLLSGRISRYALAIQKFNFELVHIPGTKNITADCLSRLAAVRPPTASDKLFRVSSWLKLPSNFVAKNMNNHQKTPNWATLSVSRVLSLKMTFCIFGGRKESSTVCVSLKRSNSSLYGNTMRLLVILDHGRLGRHCELRSGGQT